MPETFSLRRGNRVSRPRVYRRQVFPCVAPYTSCALLFRLRHLPGEIGSPALGQRLDLHGAAHFLQILIVSQIQPGYVGNTDMTPIPGDQFDGISGTDLPLAQHSHVEAGTPTLGEALDHFSLSEPDAE